jgi:hypothetical protein
MAFRYEDVLPWGRSYDEYRRMFALRPDDLAKWVLGCADGPASFNSELTRRGGRVISVDPVYKFSAEALARGIDETRHEVISQTRNEQHRFVWDTTSFSEEGIRCSKFALQEGARSLGLRYDIPAICTQVTSIGAHDTHSQGVGPLSKPRPCGARTEEYGLIWATFQEPRWAAYPYRE